MQLVRGGDCSVQLAMSSQLYGDNKLIAQLACQTRHIAQLAHSNTLSLSILVSSNVVCHLQLSGDLTVLFGEHEGDLLGGCHGNQYQGARQVTIVTVGVHHGGEQTVPPRWWRGGGGGIFHVLPITTSMLLLLLLLCGNQLASLYMIHVFVVVNKVKTHFININLFKLLPS